MSSLDIIRYFAEQQRLDHANWLSLGLESSLLEDEYLAIDVGNGRYRLAPYPESSTRLFRGQNFDYGVCLPTIYRNGSSLASRVLAMAKIRELKQTLEALDGYKEHNKLCGLSFSVDYEGLAQHYGLATRYVDFTTNPLIAGFFATTLFDAESSEYKPIINKGEGIFYEVNRAFEFARSNEIEIIGLQPFQRPAQQYAFGLKCSKYGLHKNYMLKEYKFIHGKQSNVIFELNEGGRKLFPDDPVSSICHKVNSTNYLSRSSVEWALATLQVRNMDKQIKSLNSLGISVGLDLANYVAQNEIEAISAMWNRQAQLFNSKVKVRYVADHK
ncbi:MAG: FRG domain-containing protein [Pseudoalteromonas sp.]|uniref:FRG domain-containing protein n=1 Tax=Pseudoalteromonas nigrifaciens TaxID=28109 RepID=UPI003F974FE3